MTRAGHEINVSIDEFTSAARSGKWARVPPRIDRLEHALKVVARNIVIQDRKARERAHNYIERQSGKRILAVSPSGSDPERRLAAHKGPSLSPGADRSPAETHTTGVSGVMGRNVAFGEQILRCQMADIAQAEGRREIRYRRSSPAKRAAGNWAA
jgi:hypothetical protein